MKIKTSALLNYVKKNLNLTTLQKEVIYVRCRQIELKLQVSKNNSTPCDSFHQLSQLI